MEPVQGGEENPIQLPSKQIISDAKSSASSPNANTPTAFTSINKRAE